MKFIDSHVHVGINEDLNRSWTINSYIHFHREQEGEGALIMPNLTKHTSTFHLNEQLLKAFLTQPYEEFFPVFMIDPNDYDVLAQIEKNHEFLYALKYHPSFFQIASDSVRLAPYWGVAQVRNLPVIIHCGRDKISNINYLLEAALVYPKTRFVAAHLGGNAVDIIEKALILIKKSQLDNVWLDTSSVKLPWAVEQAIKTVGVEKILFGSDEPYADLRLSIMTIHYANITEKEKEKIFYANAKEFFHIGF